MINFHCLKSFILKIYFVPTNILFTLTDVKGKVIFWTSTGTWKIKGTKKITSTTIELVLKQLLKKLKYLDYKHLHIEMRGFSKNKKIIVKSLRNNYIRIKSVRDKTANPHNGCKNKKIRRI